jgi:putrescine transport system permease protein
MKISSAASIFFGSKKNDKSLLRRIANIEFLLALLPFIWLFLFFVLPFFIVLKISFSSAKLAIPPFSDVFSWVSDSCFSICLNLSNYAKFLRDSYYREAFFNSVVLSFFATTGCLIIGYVIAFGISQMPKRSRPILLLFISLSFWTSFLIRIYAWINLFSTNGFVNFVLMKFGITSAPIQFLGNYYALCIGLVFCYLPFMVFPIYAALEKIEPLYADASYDLGNSPWRTFWKITVPLSKSGIIAGCLLVFSGAVGEFVIPELLGGPEAVTIGRILWLEFFNLDWPMACSMSIMMLLFVIFPVYMSQKYDPAGERRT